MNTREFKDITKIMDLLPTEFLKCWARGHDWQLLKEETVRSGIVELSFCDSCTTRREGNLDRWWTPLGNWRYEYPEGYRVALMEDVDISGIATIWLRRAAKAILAERRAKAA